MPFRQLAHSSLGKLVPPRPMLRWLSALGMLLTVCTLNTACQRSESRHAQGCTQVGCLKLNTTPGGLPAYACLRVNPQSFPAIKAQSAPRVVPKPAGAATFQLHSRPGNTKVIYLDFTGHTTTGTQWNSDLNANSIVTSPYDVDGDSTTFSALEQANIVEIWQRVAECYSPFDVDVTTEPPAVADLINTGGGDTKWGIRVLFGPSNPDPAPGAGGVAYVGGFGKNDGNGTDAPCFVYQGNAPNKINADTAVHEAGHTVGLSHDGLFPKGDPNHVEYYTGQGTGKIGWAPHMGAGYYQPIVQWSKGEYANPSNTEDDLAIITTQNGFGYRPDDYASSQIAAKNIPGTPGTNSLAVNVSGVIETTGDSDWFKIVCGSGAMTLNAVGGPANTMLDIQMTLYDTKGNAVVTANPPTDVIASISQAVTAGTYYLKIEGVGVGDPLTTGYTRYSSLGQYTITGSFSTKGLKGAPVLTKPANLFYGIKDLPKPINTILVVSDPDSTTQASATVSITKNFVPAEDVLSLTVNPATMGNITASYDNSTGVLTLTSDQATATLAQFQAALRAVSYSNTSGLPKLTPRTVTFQTFDGIINSNPITSTITIGYYYVTATYNSGSKTLTVTDSAVDNADNGIMISLRAGQIFVEGAGATRIGTSASNKQSVNFPYSGDVKIVCNFSGGSDTVSLVSLNSSDTKVNLGVGNDSLTVTYCTITKLAVDGGPDTDIVKLIGTKVANPPTYTNVP
ncbi:MAG: hypothetical protein JSS49_23720 [Planctomycetes bacterium]|nr:hypothetical protein [Planctomycetota bacterium]